MYIYTYIHYLCIWIYKIKKYGCGQEWRKKMNIVFLSWDVTKCSNSTWYSNCKAKAGSSGASISLRLLFSDSFLFCFVLLKSLLHQPGGWALTQIVFCFPPWVSWDCLCLYWFLMFAGSTGKNAIFICLFTFRMLL